MSAISPSKRTVLITGVSRGLGRAMADEFARCGHIVLGCARGNSHIAALRRAHPAPHDFQPVDVMDMGQVQSWATMLARQGFVPDLLLNNAAVINQNAPLWKVSCEEFSRVIDVNIKGAANVLRAFVPRMLEQGRGIIVNFSSGWGRSADAEVAPYCASKWAIEGLSKALAQELPAGFASIPLNPGIIDTEMLRSCFGSSAGAFPSPERWAKAAVPFLLGLSPKHNGESLTVPL